MEQISSEFIRMSAVALALMQQNPSSCQTLTRLYFWASCEVRQGTRMTHLMLRAHYVGAYHWLGVMSPWHVA
eukprot:2065382-Amphidinium_carterae.1